MFSFLPVMAENLEVGAPSSQPRTVSFFPLVLSSLSFHLYLPVYSINLFHFYYVLGPEDAIVNTRIPQQYVHMRTHTHTYTHMFSSPLPCTVYVLIEENRKFLLKKCLVKDIVCSFRTVVCFSFFVCLFLLCYLGVECSISSLLNPSFLILFSRIC